MFNRRNLLQTLLFSPLCTLIGRNKAKAEPKDFRGETIYLDFETTNYVSQFGIGNEVYYYTYGNYPHVRKGIITNIKHFDNSKTQIGGFYYEVDNIPHSFVHESFICTIKQLEDAVNISLNNHKPIYVMKE
jgi:hypothetical protein